MAEEKIIRPKEPQRTPEEERLAELYEQVGVPLDRLPYTDDFETLFRKFAMQFPRPDDNEGRHDVLQRLLNMRKAGKLPYLRAIKPGADMNWPDVG